MNQTTSTAHRRSRRFLRNIAWLTTAGLLLVSGQIVRWHATSNQVHELNHEISRLYSTSLGSNYGDSPFGRLQFTLGKLRAARQSGLDPLGVLAAMSRPAGLGISVESMNLEGDSGVIKGRFLPDPQNFKRYLDELAKNDAFAFTLQDRREAFGAIAFTLKVARR